MRGCHCQEDELLFARGLQTKMSYMMRTPRLGCGSECDDVQKSFLLSEDFVVRFVPRRTYQILGWLVTTLFYHDLVAGQRKWVTVSPGSPHHDEAQLSVNYPQ